LGADAGKVLVVVDEDIDARDADSVNARDADSVNWALSFHMQPHGDVHILEARMMGLDPSIVPSEDFDVKNLVNTSRYIDNTLTSVLCWLRGVVV
jgi:UbiD family decarboxylase